ncbi:hypothetical protein [Hymenobacter sp. BT730]|uniref:hypothetical protein n=1 Tax=Hymenobacter sp. BT730 TaxID=3063332 RepID=UPI0026DEBCFF|nr:hypothetical protein [Hymenobacter sp. BT730]
MELQWFEMRDVRKRKLNTSVWIPLQASQDVLAKGEHGHLGQVEEYFGAGSLAVPLARKAEAMALGWNRVGSGPDHIPWIHEGRYVQADTHADNNGLLLGLRLVLKQHLNHAERNQWHLHQDLVLALHLQREGDIWVCPTEGYTEVARLQRGDNGEPCLLEIKAEYLRDYLCAREMGLYVSSYRSRYEVKADTNGIVWQANPTVEEEADQRWEGQIQEINEGGMQFGAGTAFIHVGRKEVDLEDEVPAYGLPDDDEVVLDSWQSTAQGRKLFRVWGELWRDEWLEPASASPRVREDDVPATSFFITDASGQRESRDTLDQGSRWLWFRPQVIMDLVHRRGGALMWYTRETGRVSCSPGYNVDFGLNKLGLVNVFAKDIGNLPDWQQQLWAGNSIGPDGGISPELHTVQMQAIPADTQAPEAFFGKGIELLNKLFEQHYQGVLFREHEISTDLIGKVHRFRATTEEGLYELAKDVARLTADSLNIGALHQHTPPPKGEKWGSLKSLEKLLAQRVGPEKARALLTPLVGTYELRLADAHLPSSKTKDALALVNIDETLPFVWQGYQLLAACTGAIYQIAKVLSAEGQIAS